ncbi:hypothetical protein ABZ410_02660, partial [Streptomyces cinnamoneus]
MSATISRVYGKANGLAELHPAAHQIAQAERNEEPYMSTNNVDLDFGPGTVVAKNKANFADDDFGPGTVVAKN